MTRTHSRRLALVAIALLGSCVGLSASGTDAAPAQVVLIGTYHFANPGRDVVNMKAPDVLAPERQREIAAVTRALARFEPTKVGVEWPAAVAQTQYDKFREGSLPESRNEIVQLGFRLARERGLTSVQGLDVDGDFPYEALLNWARERGRTAQLDAITANLETEVDRLSTLQSQTSIGGVLRYMNSADAITRSHAFYPPMLLFGAGEEQPGVQVLSGWYTRNLAICARLLQAVAPGDRMVVIYGQGHIYLLRQCLSEQANVKLVDPLRYLTEDPPTKQPR